MTIYWTFYNTPKGNESFRVRLAPSLLDHIFSFNLAVHTPGDNQWFVLPNFVNGSEADQLNIQGRPGQDLLLIVKDRKGTEKRLRYPSDAFWVGIGDIGSIFNIAEYQKYFEESMGLTEHEMFCEALFEEYKKLQAATHMEAQILKPGQPYKVNQLNLQDLMRLRAVAKELKEHCEDYFKDKPAEWFEILKDAD